MQKKQKILYIIYKFGRIISYLFIIMGFTIFIASIFYKDKIIPEYLYDYTFEEMANNYICACGFSIGLLGFISLIDCDNFKKKV